MTEEYNEEDLNADDLSDVEESWDEYLSKRNRRTTQERKTHDLEQGAPVPDGVHKVEKKSKARRAAKEIRRARRG